jgi:hypothetical protein
MPGPFKLYYVKPTRDNPNVFRVWQRDYYDLTAPVYESCWSQYFASHPDGKWWAPDATWDYKVTRTIRGPDLNSVTSFQAVVSWMAKDRTPPFLPRGSAGYDVTEIVNR